MKTYGIGMLAGIAAALLSGSSVASAATINLGTGQSPGIIDTASDPIWTIVSAASGNTSGPAVLLGSPIWGAAPDNLHWIATDPVRLGGSQYATGNFDYRTTFIGSGVLSFSVKADNAVTVYLDNTAILNWGDPNGVATTGFTTFSPVQTVNIASPSAHSLDLVVHNDSSYTGVLLQGELTTAPEPGTYVLLVSGLGLIAAGRRRSKAKLRTREIE